MSQLPARPASAEAFLSAFSPGVQALAHRLRAMVLAALPTALEQVDLPAKLLAYGWAATYKATICVIMPLKAGVNLGFPFGAELPDPAGLLTGTGKRARHVRLTHPAELEQPALRALIDASADLAERKSGVTRPGSRGRMS